MQQRSSELFEEIFIVEEQSGIEWRDSMFDELDINNIIEQNDDLEGHDKYDDHDLMKFSKTLQDNNDVIVNQYDSKACSMFIELRFQLIGLRRNEDHV